MKKTYLFVLLIIIITVGVSCSKDDDAVITTITIKDFTTTIEENPTMNQELGTIKATTNQGKLAFSIKSETPKGAIAIDAATGKLTVKKASLFDYEAYHKLTAVVLAVNGEVTKEANVTIVLKDIEDSGATTITIKDFTATIEENPKVGQELGTVEATTNRGELSFSLKNETPKGAMSIDEITGKLMVKEASLFDPKTHPKLTAIVLAVNGDISKEANVEITFKTSGKNIVFPDKNFKKKLLKHDPKIDINDDGEISIEEAKNVKNVDVPVAYITDLTGIEYFTNLERLNCSVNMLKVLDVSKNTVLKELHCFYNQIGILNVSNNSNLKILNCGNNELNTLDVSVNIALETLYCGMNKLKTLDISKNTNLVKLICSKNQLTVLDVSKNIVLEELYCVDNQLSMLNVGKNSNLKVLGSSSNPLGILDVSKNIVLESLFCASNQLTTLDLTKNINLKELGCSNNRLTTLDVSKNIDLVDLTPAYNQLSVIDISKNTAIELLWVTGNKLNTLDISNNKALTVLRCVSNLLTTLDASANTNLETLYCKDNQLTSLNLKNGATDKIINVTMQGNAPGLCVEVDDPSASNIADWIKDSGTTFKRVCDAW
ncbi:hypothetical protein [Aquimarina sp. AU58]|uniref:hypothetical protein n=1 Tax=Aquimarina sp. AU58 TaxID=1874112 RepID=UPI000D65194A|nr:hypothetical protein [Aquimarina sp. AU58]